MENMDWGALGFDYRKTDANVRYYYTDGKWSEMEVTGDEYIKIHMSASCLHYGIELFEGLKAFRGVDGKVRLFRVEENAKRLQSSAERLCLPVPTIEMIVKACVEVVKRNEKYIPPYGTGASLYLRPVMFGTTAGLGVKPAKDALLIVYCSPVGAYFKDGIKPISVAIDREQDRAAPRGTGDVKVGGNYASSLLSGENGHKLGYSNIMYLDAAEHKYIEECGACNLPIRCSSMQSTGNISRSAAPPISSVSKTILTLRRNRPRSCLRSPTRVCGSWRGIWDLRSKTV